jgi:hypothetical protein
MDQKNKNLKNCSIGRGKDLTKLNPLIQGRKKGKKKKEGGRGGKEGGILSKSKPES